MILSFVLIFLLFFLPFIILPIPPSFFETPKIYIAEICIILFCIYNGFRKFDIHIFKQKIPLVIFGLILLLSIFDLIYRNSSVSFFGNQIRHQGIFLLWLLLLFAFFTSKIKIKLPLWLMSIFCFVEFLASIFLTSEPNVRSVGTLGEPNALASFACFLWVFTAFQSHKTSLSKIYFSFSTIFVLAIIFLSGSRSGLIAFVIEAIFFILIKLRLNLAKTTFICLLLFLLSLSLPFFQKDVVYENRSEIWNAALIAGYQHPILGWGFGNTELALTQYDKKLNNGSQGYYVDSSHNIFLDFWVEGGYVGLSLFILLLYIFFRQSIGKKKLLNLALMLGFLVSLSFNPASIVGLLGFWWILGQGVFT